LISQDKVFSKLFLPINVLILKDKQIRIRSDRSIPLTIKGQRFSNKKIKGLTTWEINGKLILGVLSLNELSKLTGFKN